MCVIVFIPPEDLPLEFCFVLIKRSRAAEMTYCGSYRPLWASDEPAINHLPYTKWQTDLIFNC